MRPDKNKVEDLLRRKLPSASREQIESARKTVYDYAHSDAAEDFEKREVVRRGGRAWLPQAAAAMALLVAAIWTGIEWRNGNVFEAVMETSDSFLYRVQRGQPVPVHAGEGIESGETIRTNNVAGGTLKLSDGSRVEVRSLSELALERAGDGLRIRLDKGGLIISAAKQPAGRHLYVQTKDVTVSVVGTVFLVNTEDLGSRVAVIEGEVRVKQGVTEERLHPGQQLSTTPKMAALPVSQQIAWSREAASMLELLQQSTSSQNSEPRLAFEEASIRLAGVPSTAGRGATTGSRRRNPRPAGEPCGSPREPILDPRRFDASETTVHALIAWAYGVDCNQWRGSDLIFGAPQWAKDDGYDVVGLIPEGTPRYTSQQFNAHKAPELQKMLQTLLAERFKLVLRRETRELPAYVLSIAKGGPRMIPSPIGKKSDANMVTLPNGNVVRGPGYGPPLVPGLSVWKEGDDDCCSSATPEGIAGVKQPMSYLTSMLSFALGRPVLDRTGMTGEFYYFFTFEPQNPPGTPGPSGAPRPPNLPPPDTRSVSTAIEQDLGLKLESTKEKMEVFVIDRIERPTEN